MSNMREIGIEKINLNIGVGSPGDKLEKAMKLLTTISGAKPIQTTAKKRIPTWGLRLGLPIATKVTVRKKKAKEILVRLLIATNKTLRASCFDDYGNISFGVKEYLDIPGVDYDPEVGIIGLEVAVTLQRPGFRIRRRSLKKKIIPKSHRITKKEAMEYMKREFEVNIE